MKPLFFLANVLITVYIGVSCTKCSNDSITKKWQDSMSVSNPIITMRTVHGNIDIELLPEKAPNSVTRIIQLVEKGAYDGVKFHRVIPNFIVQTGDISEQFPEENNKPLKAEVNNTQHVKGTVAFARQNGDLDSATTQFYISLTRLAHLDSQYTVFGNVIRGLDVLDKIKQDDKIITLALIK